MQNRIPTSQPPARAILLLGPSGSGKTPLGELAHRRGLWREQCVHFDFGANLRLIVGRGTPDGPISREDIDFLRRVLESGALLENEHLPLARHILQSFLARNPANDRTLVLLNGFPRHVGQAEAIRPILDVRTVVHLRCSGEVVLQRIRSNVGGDRTSREDDDAASVRNKLDIFEKRTAPLLEHYRRQGARIQTIDLTAQTTPEQLWQTLNSKP